jgi:hypothetical protein
MHQHMTHSVGTIFCCCWTNIKGEGIPRRSPRIFFKAFKKIIVIKYLQYTTIKKSYEVAFTSCECWKEGNTFKTYILESRVKESSLGNLNCMT